MYLVEWNNANEVYSQDCKDLDEALAVSKNLGCFVTIRGNGNELVGKFGVDSVKDGICPDGVDYNWKKRRR